MTNEDARFQGKVVLVNITGSWCPNCHDETPFLVSLYNKYHEQGLEIVVAVLRRSRPVEGSRPFARVHQKIRHRLPVLMAGDWEQANAKLPQMANFNAWPTTFFIGRDGLVRGAHAGFPSSGSGEMFTKAKEEFAAHVRKAAGRKRPDIARMTAIMLI